MSLTQQVVPDGVSVAEVAAHLAVVFAAGFVAERLWGFEPVNHEFSDTSDYTALLKLPGLGNAPVEAQESYAATVLKATRDFLELPPIRTAIMLLACAMETRITLSHTEAAAIAEEVWRRDVAVPQAAEIR